MPDPRDGPTDEDILTRLSVGDSEWFGTLIRRHERELYGYLRRYLGREDLAEEVFQATFVQVFRKIGQYAAGRPAKPWLYTIATNQAIDALRRRARRKDKAGQEHPPESREADTSGSPLDLLPANTEDPLDLVVVDEQRTEVRQAVNQLPDAFRSVIILTYFHGMKLQDVGEILGIPLGTVKSRLHAASAKLLAILRPTGDETP